MSTSGREPRSAALLLCYITDRKQFAGDDHARQRHLLAKVRECAAAGVDFIQLREKDLSPRELEELAGQAVAAIPAASPTPLPRNSRAHVTLPHRAHRIPL